jgi:6-phosphogluconolactonase
VDPEGEYLAVAHYRSGSLAVLPLTAGGAGIRAVQETVQHGGTSPQQTGSPDGSRLHCVVPCAGGNLLLAADLGQDTVTSYRLHRASLKLRGVDQLSLAAGTGPRHLILNRAGNLVFATCERDSSILAIRLDRQGRLKLEAQEGATMADPAVANRPSDLVLGPLGDRLYVANRGADVITEFAIDGTRLAPVQEVSCLGRGPRHLAMVGRTIIIANQDSDNVVRLAPERRSGILRPAGKPLSLPSPACVAVATYGGSRTT